MCINRCTCDISHIHIYVWLYHIYIYHISYIIYIYIYTWFFGTAFPNRIFVFLHLEPASIVPISSRPTIWIPFRKFYKSIPVRPFAVVIWGYTQFINIYYGYPISIPLTSPVVPKFDCSCWISTSPAPLTTPYSTFVTKWGLITFFFQVVYWQTTGHVWPGF